MKNEDEHIYKSHNKSLLLYHFVFPAKYRRKVFSATVDEKLREISVGISERYEINFIEIGVDEDHVHFLLQSVPMYSVTQLEPVHTIESTIIANKINPANIISSLS